MILRRQGPNGFLLRTGVNQSDTRRRPMGPPEGVSDGFHLPSFSSSHHGPLHLTKSIAYHGPSYCHPWQRERARCAGCQVWWLRLPGVLLHSTHRCSGAPLVRHSKRRWSSPMALSLDPVLVPLPSFAKTFRESNRAYFDDWLFRLLWRLKPHYPPSSS